MHLIRLKALCIYIASMRAQHICSEDNVFAIAGCNATLEWIMGYSQQEVHTMTITVFNTRGTTIAHVEDITCENYTVNCEIVQREQKFVLSLSLDNITKTNSENFTGLIKSWTGERNVTKQLTVIDMAQIVKSPKPSLDEPMNLSCTIAGNLVGAKYRWKLNGSYLNCTGRICARSSILTIDNLRMEDKLNIFSCEVCTEGSCCVESEAYTPDPYFVGNKEDSKGVQQVPLGIGLVLSALFLVMVGFSILFKLRGSLTMHRSCARQVNIEACQDVLHFKKQNRPLPIPEMQDNAHRITMRSKCPSIHRKSRSLHKLFGHNQDFWIPVRKTLSLQTLIELSQTLRRRASMDDSVVRMYSVKQNSWSSMERHANGMKMEEMHFKDLKGKRVSSVEFSTDSMFPNLNISRHGCLDQDPREDIYNTIDEVTRHKLLSLTFYDPPCGK